MPQLTALLSRWPLSLPAGAARQALFGVCAVLLAAILGFLYLKTQGADIKRQNEVLALLRELKEIDSRWDVEILRSRSEFEPPPPAVPDYGATLARLRRELAAASTALGSPVLQRSLPDLETAITRKAEMVAQFKKASADSKAALAQVLGSDAEIAALVRGSWQDFRERDRLVAAENAAVHLIAEAQRYYFAPTEAQRRVAETVAADLRQAGTRLPVALREGLARLDGRVKALLAAKPDEDGLYRKLSFITAGPRIASLTSGFSRELESALADQEFYRAYLVAYSGALLILLGYLATRLAASYRLLNAANAALKSANEDLEQRVAERTRELSETLKQLKQSEAQLIQSEKMSSLGQMVAGVVHEINTPLAYVKNSLGSVTGKLPDLARLVGEIDKLLELLRAGAANPEDLAQQFGVTERLVAQFRQRHLIEEMQALVKDGLHGIGQISELVVNLRNFSRLDRSKVASCNLNDGLESTLLLARHELKDRTVKKNLGDIPPITCSPSQVNQVFLNLINNAAQATQPGKGVIVITTRREDEGHVAVEVEDNGTGIPPEVLPRIFDPFFTTKDVGKGTGLGLSIAYKIVEQHGGRIRVGSTVGVGTRFSVVLPLTPPEAATGVA
jgi:two-component system, NtrC family, sensor kinase